MLLDQSYLEVIERHLYVVNVLRKQHVFVLESTSDLLSLRKHLYSQEKEITFSKDEINTTVREIKKGTGNTLEDDRYIFTETYYQRH